MGVVIRMNMAAGLGRAELSWAQAVVRNRCQLTHICRACWDAGVSGHSSDHLRDTVHLGPPKTTGFFSWFTVSPESCLSLSVYLSVSLLCPHTQIQRQTCTNTNISGIKNKFPTLIWRSKVLANGRSWIVTQTGKVWGCLNVNTHLCNMVEREIRWSFGNVLWNIWLHYLYYYVYIVCTSFAPLTPSLCSCSQAAAEGEYATCDYCHSIYLAERDMLTN